MGTATIVILTSLGWVFMFYLIGFPAYRRGYHKGYFNGWDDKLNNKTYNNNVKK